MKPAAACLCALLGVLPGAPEPARTDRLAYVTVKLHNLGDQPLVVTMHDERDGRTFVVRVSPRKKSAFGLQSSQVTENCCGAVSYATSAGANQHRENLKDGDIITVP